MLLWLDNLNNQFQISSYEPLKIVKGTTFDGVLNSGASKHIVHHTRLLEEVDTVPEKTVELPGGTTVSATHRAFISMNVGKNVQYNAALSTPTPCIWNYYPVFAWMITELHPL